jgi:hypothetical protein
VVDERVQLAAEEVHRPEVGRRVAQVLGAAVADLVVQDDLPPVAREVAMLRT